MGSWWRNLPQVEKDCKKVDGGMQMKWETNRVSKRVSQMDQLSNKLIGLEYQVRNGKVLSETKSSRRNMN